MKQAVGSGGAAARQASSPPNPSLAHTRTWQLFLMSANVPSLPFHLQKQGASPAEHG